MYHGARIGCLGIVVSFLAGTFLPRTTWAADLKEGVEQLADQLTKSVPEQKQLRVAVTDFPDLQGVISDLGRYIAERLTTRLSQHPNFSVIERRRLGQVLGELKFSVSDLVDPDKAKQLGKMLGVEALVVGSLSDLGNVVDVDARIIEIESNHMLPGALISILKDQVVQQMMERGREASAPTGSPLIPSQAPSGSRQASQRLFISGITWKGIGPLPRRTSPQDGRSSWWFDKEFDDKGWEELTLPIPERSNEKIRRWDARQDVLARLHFNFKPGAGKVLLNFESDDGIWIYVNGQSIGHWGGDFDEIGCVNRRCAGGGKEAKVDPVDITSHLAPGPNVIAFRVHNSEHYAYFFATIVPEF